MSGIKFPTIKLPKIKWPPKEPPAQSPKKIKNVHPWRECPLGEHWRRDHPMRTKRGFTQVRGHCVENSSKKDQIYPEELEKIAEEYFGKLKGSPRNDDLNYPQGNKFDHLIRGWTKYWNEVLKPSESLDPDLVKALIATESSFKITEENYAGKKSRSSKGFNASYRLDHRNTER